jgi:hypothetical protein
MNQRGNYTEFGKETNCEYTYMLSLEYCSLVNSYEHGDVKIWGCIDKTNVDRIQAYFSNKENVEI